MTSREQDIGVCNRCEKDYVFTVGRDSGYCWTCEQIKRDHINGVRVREPRQRDRRR